jgi:hypothetical protein
MIIFLLLLASIGLQPWFKAPHELLQLNRYGLLAQYYEIFYNAS